MDSIAVFSVGFRSWACLEFSIPQAPKGGTFIWLWVTVLKPSLKGKCQNIICFSADGRWLGPFERLHFFEKHSNPGPTEYRKRNTEKITLIWSHRPFAQLCAGSYVSWSEKTLPRLTSFRGHIPPNHLRHSRNTKRLMDSTYTYIYINIIHWGMPKPCKQWVNDLYSKFNCKGNPTNLQYPHCNFLNWCPRLVPWILKTASSSISCIKFWLSKVSMWLPISPNPNMWLYQPKISHNVSQTFFEFTPFTLHKRILNAIVRLVINSTSCF